MYKYKKQLLTMFGAIAIITYMSVQNFPELGPKESITVMEELKEEQLQIYVLDKDAALIPMAKKISAGTAIEEKIQQMVEAMCADQVQGDFSGVLGKGTKVETVEITGSVAKLYFNEAFATYLPEQELRVVEALVWGTTQFSEIQSIELYYQGERLTQMPLARTPLKDPLDRSIGINHFESASASLHNSATITVFYTKDIDGTTYFVPKSKRIEGDKEDMQTVVKEILKDVSASSSLSQPLYEDNIDIADLPRKEADTLVVNMSNTLLDSDRSAKQSAYEALVLSLSTNFDAERVMVYVDENVVSLHGSNEEALQVSSLSYNPIPF